MVKIFLLKISLKNTTGISFNTFFSHDEGFLVQEGNDSISLTFYTCLLFEKFQREITNSIEIFPKIIKLDKA